MSNGSNTAYVMCIDNDGYTVSLEVRRIYLCKPDPDAAEQGLLRVVDDTGEDYLYPKELFEPVTMSEAVRAARRVR